MPLLEDVLLCLVYRQVRHSKSEFLKLEYDKDSGFPGQEDRNYTPVFLGLPRQTMGKDSIGRASSQSLFCDPAITHK